MENMAVKALNLQLDNLKHEVQALQVENAKLREANPRSTITDQYRAK